MIAALLSAGAQLAAQPIPEIWEPRLTWGCVISDRVKKPFVVNGIIAQRNEPANPNVHLRFQRALRVIRDDSGAFTGLQARPPMFVVHPQQYWAFLKGDDGRAFGPKTRSLILTKDEKGRPVKIDLVADGGRATKPYASGRCTSRVLSPEIVQ